MRKRQKETEAMKTPRFRVATPASTVPYMQKKYLPHLSYRYLELLLKQLNYILPEIVSFPFTCHTIEYTCIMQLHVQDKQSRDSVKMWLSMWVLKSG